MQLETVRDMQQLSETIEEAPRDSEQQLETVRDMQQLTETGGGTERQ